MTSHYDLKQQEKNNSVLVDGLGGGSQIFLSYICGGGGGVEYFFPSRLGGSSKFLPTT